MQLRNVKSENNITERDVLRPNNLKMERIEHTKLEKADRFQQRYWKQRHPSRLLAPGLVILRSLNRNLNTLSYTTPISKFSAKLESKSSFLKTIRPCRFRVLSRVNGIIKAEIIEALLCCEIEIVNVILTLTFLE